MYKTGTCGPQVQERLRVSYKGRKSHIPEPIIIGVALFYVRGSRDWSRSLYNR